MSIQEQAVIKAVAMLNAANCQFKIITVDGKEYGELEAVVKKISKRKSLEFPMGTYSNYAAPYLKNLQVSEVVTIPAGPYDVEKLRAAVTGWCGARWGSNSHMSSINRENNTVEILRFA